MQTQEYARPDTDLVRDAMRSGEWLRTQWIARVAFGLNAEPWGRDHAARISAALRRLEVAGEVRSRLEVEDRKGKLAGSPVSFSIPRVAWKLGTA